MYVYENTLSQSLSNLLATSDVDSANWQHMVTYTVSFGVIGALNPNDYDPVTLKNKTAPYAYLTWPNFNDGNNDHKIDDMWHAAVNGRGKFFPATNPNELVSSLTQ